MKVRGRLYGLLIVFAAAISANAAPPVSVVAKTSVPDYVGGSDVAMYACPGDAAPCNSPDLEISPLR